MHVLQRKKRIVKKNVKRRGKREEREMKKERRKGKRRGRAGVDEADQGRGIQGGTIGGAVVERETGQPTYM